MVQDTISELTELLAGFKSMGNIEAALVTSKSGINLASHVPPGANADSLAAMSSTLQNAGDFITTQFKKGHSIRVVVECEHSKLVIISAGSKAHFIVLTSDNVNLGPLFLEMGYTAEKIEKLLDTG